MNTKNRVSLYFVASPLHYLAAQCIAENFETESSQVLVWYNPNVAPVVNSELWDASGYMPWPRHRPLPGFFGRHRRLRENIHLVADLVGKCEELHIYSAVFDTEAINYFLRALPKMCGAKQMRARIFPDGILNIHRHPRSRIKIVAQYLRKFRRLVAPELDYWCFSGDRIGSDAAFCDRIFVLPNLPHEYSPDKVTVLPPLVNVADSMHNTTKTKRALVIGQPLVGFGLLNPSELNHIGDEIRDWLEKNEFEHVDYKAHPKDPNFELSREGDKVLEIDEPLEAFMSHTPYSAVIGVSSTALLFARQIYPDETPVLSFGFGKIRFKTENIRDNLCKVFMQAGVEIK